MRSTLRRSTVTESFESTVIRFQSGSSFRFCEGCEKCGGGHGRTENEISGHSLEQILLSGKFQVTRVEHGTLILCAGAPPTEVN